MKKFLLSHPTGNSNVREVLKILNSKDLLDSFYTTVAFSKNQLLYKACPGFVKNKLNRRYYDLESKFLHTAFFDETIRLIKQRLFPESQSQHHLQIDALYYGHDARVAQHLHKHPISHVYAYEDGALLTFEAAKTRGIRCCYELPIAYWETAHQLLHEEAKRYPAWESSLLATRDNPTKCARKTEELLLADEVICPSEFVRQSLPESIRNQKPCHVIPYGAPLPSIQINTTPGHKKRPLNILFVGSFSQRKGLADIFQAFQHIPQSMAHLTLLGTPIHPLSFYQKQLPHFKFLPSCSHSEVLKIMQHHDLLILPSIIEGRALVQLEALGCGLPILITPNTGGDDMVIDGHNGFLIPIRDPGAICEKIEFLYENQDQLPQMRLNARKTAEAFSWKHFENLFVQKILQES
jgi:glycosyltransferase involved in cell wall biosynthesis